MAQAYETEYFTKTGFRDGSGKFLGKMMTEMSGYFGCITMNNTDIAKLRILEQVEFRMRPSTKVELGTTAICRFHHKRKSILNRRD